MVKTHRLLATLVVLAVLTVTGIGADVYMTFFGKPPIQRRVEELERKQRQFEDLILDPAMKRYIQEGPYK